MITNKKELRLYKSEDKKALELEGGFFSMIKHPSSYVIWKYEKALRNLEYHINKNHPVRSLFWHIILFTKGQRLCLAFPPNAFGPGLAIVHRGIFVNQYAKVGKNCRLLADTVIGSTNGEAAAPTLGDNVFVGVGAKIIGNVKIADDVCIGANAVVVRDILEKGTTWGGCPAHKISNKNSHDNLSHLLTF